MEVLDEKIEETCFESEKDCTDDEIPLSSYVLTSFPFIIENIFQCLSAKRLNTCSSVCKVWHATAKKVKRSRKPVVWNYFKEENKKNNGIHNIVSDVQHFVQNLPIEPMFVLMFCSTNLLDEPVKLQQSTRFCRTSKAERIDIAEFMNRQLPSTCRLCAISADGIIGTSSNMKQTEELEGSFAMSCVCFAEMDKVEISQMYLDGEQGNTLARYWNDIAEENDLQFPLIPRDRLLRMVVFLCDEAFCSQELGFSLYKLYNHPLVVGGFVDNLVCPPAWLNDHTTDSPYLCCVGFGGENLRVASVILKDDVRDKDEVAKMIKTLKDVGLPEENSLGFMFACVGRGRKHYKESNVESTIFHKYFPKTPLLGFFGNGEVGFQYPIHPPRSDLDKAVDQNNFNTSQTKYMNTHPPKLYHAYTTVLCLVAFSCCFT